MVLSVLKIHFPKQKRNKVVCRDYKNFRTKNPEPDEELSKFNIHNIEFEQFSNIF